MGDKGRFRAAPANHVTSYLHLPKHKHHFSGDKKKRKKTSKKYEFTLLGLHRKMWKTWAKWSSSWSWHCSARAVPTGQRGKEMLSKKDYHGRWFYFSKIPKDNVFTLCNRSLLNFVLQIWTLPVVSRSTKKGKSHWCSTLFSQILHQNKKHQQNELCSPMKTVDSTALPYVRIPFPQASWSFLGLFPWHLQTLSLSSLHISCWRYSAQFNKDGESAKWGLCIIQLQHSVTASPLEQP